MQRKTVVSVTSSLVLASMLAAAPAFADTTAVQQQGTQHARGQRMPGIFGTVASISGTTITVTSKAFGRGEQDTAATADKTYTVDASSATVDKSGSTSSVSSIAVGDTVMVEGTVNGTSVTAKTIRDGMPQGMGGKHPEGQAFGAGATIKGNGQPIVGGTVSSVNGTSISITNESNAAYTVDASSATVVKEGATSTVSAIATGDRLLVQGSVNGTSVTASSVIDQGAAPAQTQSASDESETQPAPQEGGFFGAIGRIFHRIFAFF